MKITLKYVCILFSILLLAGASGCNMNTDNNSEPRKDEIIIKQMKDYLFEKYEQVDVGK